MTGATAQEHCIFAVKVALEGQNEQAAADGLRDAIALSGLPDFYRFSEQVTQK